MASNTTRHDFRSSALAALERAKKEVGTDDPAHLRYAALELRMCLEALTYDRAQAYGEDFPPKHYGTWQPPKVLQALLDFDELADKSVTLRARRESSSDEEANEVIELGTQKVFGLKELNKMYSTLGSFLHHTTLEKILAGADQSQTMRVRCLAFIEKLAQVFASPLHNAIFASRVNFDCECGAHLKRRVPADGSDGEAVCYECDARYTLIKCVKDWEYLPRRKCETMMCPDDECRRTLLVPVEQLRPGNYWTCQGCKQRVVLALGAFIEPPQPHCQ